MKEVGEKEFQGVLEHFAELPDPRSSVNRRHILVEVIAISIAAVVAGADGPSAIQVWAEATEPVLRKYLQLPHGIPSHDTIGRVLAALRPSAFQVCFQSWIQSWLDTHEQENPKRHVAVDGKTLRRSHDQKQGLGPLHMVSAWAVTEGISLGQLATEEKSNEITAIPELLEHLDLEDTVITIDAMGCQRDIAQQIIDGKGDFVLALKANHKNLFADVQQFFDEQVNLDFTQVPMSYWEEDDKSHGRVDQRYYYQFTVPKELRAKHNWPGWKTIGVAMRVSHAKEKETIDTRFYLSSLRRNGRQFAGYVRGHWAIENTLHWTLDMTFREDENRTRDRRLADNLAWLRRFALTLYKQHPGKESLAMKRRKAGWNVDFLMELLTGQRP